YTGSAAGLLDADTNMTYAVKYLAGAYRVANGNTNQAVHYYAAKNKGMAMTSNARALDSFASATPSSDIKFSSGKKLGRSYALDESVASSSSLYSGRLDYH
ncbi:MAG: hypothetical protein WAK97_21540, partial [Pseudolabrys sp.]